MILMLLLLLILISRMFCELTNFMRQTTTTIHQQRILQVRDQARSQSARATLCQLPDREVAHPTIPLCPTLEGSDILLFVPFMLGTVSWVSPCGSSSCVELMLYSSSRKINNRTKQNENEIYI